MPTRHRKIIAASKGEVDAVVLVNGVEPSLDMSFFYATGITNGLFEGAVAIVKPDGVEVLTSRLEELSAKEAGVKTSIFETEKSRGELLKKRLTGMKRIGLNFDEVTHSGYVFVRKYAHGARLVDVSKALREARMVKDKEEVKRIARACRMASDVADRIPDLVSEGMLETEAAAELDYAMMKLGADGASFKTNASFGANTAEPHYVPSTKRLRRGQLALFDFGASHKRYVSDITRTFICGAPSKKQKEIYDIVLDAQLAAIEAVRAGANGKHVDKAARDVIDKSRYKGRFIHSTGHGLGISVHDPGGLSPLKDLTLKENMVMTIEPGIYIPKFGGVRIEDDVLVTKGGCKVLTAASKDFARI